MAYLNSRRESVIDMMPGVRCLRKERRRIYLDSDVLKVRRFRRFDGPVPQISGCVHSGGDTGSRTHSHNTPACVCHRQEGLAVDHGVDSRQAHPPRQIQMLIACKLHRYSVYIRSQVIVFIQDNDRCKISKFGII
jgi:hypothetical protein